MERRFQPCRWLRKITGSKKEKLASSPIDSLEEAVNSIGERLRAEFEEFADTYDDSAGYAVFVNNDSLDVMNRHGKEVTENNLDEAIRIARDVVHKCPEDVVDLKADCLYELGWRLEDRYWRTGRMADIDEAIEILFKAVNNSSKAHIRYARRLTVLSQCLQERFSRTASLVDLEDAIELSMKATAIQSFDEDTFYPGHTRFSALADGLFLRYKRLKTYQDLETAITLRRRIVSVCSPREVPEVQQHALAVLLLGSHMYLQPEKTDQLEEAISICLKLLGTSKKVSGRPFWLNSLALGRYYLFQSTRNPEHLEIAIQSAREGTTALFFDHPERAKSLLNLGNLLLHQYSVTSESSQLDEAKEVYSKSLAQPNAVIGVRLEAAAALSHASSLTSDWSTAYGSLKLAMRLMKPLLVRSLNNADKQFVLSEISGLAGDAAAAALHVGEEPHVALEFLEQGRGLLAESLLEYRTDIHGLENHHPGLAQRFTQLRDELTVNTQTTARSPSSFLPSFPDENDPSIDMRDEELPLATERSLRRQRIEKGFDSLIEEIRAQNGYEHFLVSPNPGAMKAAAVDGPIVVINVSEFRSDAIIVKPHQVTALSLPDLKFGDVQVRRRSLSHRLCDARLLEWLWEVLAQPVLSALGIHSAPENDNSWPHLWWIPTGLLTSFPLHAAGRHYTRDTVMDRVLSSYSPSIKSIIFSRQNRKTLSISTPSQALLVAMEHTPSLSTLRYAKKEVTLLKDFLEKQGWDCPETFPQKTNILSALKGSKIFHFAGHGSTSPSDPSGSCLMLDDWRDDPLTVASLLEQNFHDDSPFLAYLSACGTGQIGRVKFASESIHLINACQIAGFRHVIGTLWEVNDESCVEIAKVTYETIIRDGMIDESVCRGLHTATRALRDKWLQSMPEVSESRPHVKTSPFQKSNPDSISDLTRPTSSREIKDKSCAKIMPLQFFEYQILRRDVIAIDDHDDDAKPAATQLHWVPYVHFGV
ncbi:CHAT domain-containing protein [Xylariaceae sp. FL0255]|nr:CHAT domain-containing protein [Xylariaceae sp. FL0255]